MAGDNIDLEEVVRSAKERGYTKQGEMFSVEDMASLARLVLEREVEVVESKELLDCRQLMARLSEGGAVLVPYDCDHNHTPARLRGSKAHWALITGFLLPANIVNLDNIGEQLELEQADNIILLQKNFDIERLVFKQPPRIQLIARSASSLSF